MEESSVMKESSIMKESSVIPDFDKQYVVFSHGSRLIYEEQGSFRLGPEYRIVTLHIPGMKIHEKLTRIILNQIDSKMSLINNLFSIGCPIARQAVRENLEKCFIVDWLLEKHKDPISPDSVSKDLINIGDQNAYDQEITTNAQLREYVETLDFKEIKLRLAFEIRTYRPNELVPKLLLQFNFTKNLTRVDSGIFNSTDFKDFNLNETDENKSISAINSSSLSSFTDEPDSLKSLVKFDNTSSYYFDPLDAIRKNGKSFFDTIKPKIKTGLIVILSCGSYDKKTIPEKIRSSSIERQNAPYNKKYMINYN